MLPVVVCAGMALVDLARPVTPEEYAQIYPHLDRKEGLSAKTQAYYCAKGWVLACFLKKGMTSYQVGRTLGKTLLAGGDGRFNWCRQGYYPLGVVVKYRAEWIEVEGEKRPLWVVEDVEAGRP
jgi:hypothetical protein